MKINLFVTPIQLESWRQIGAKRTACERGRGTRHKYGYEHDLGDKGRRDELAAVAEGAFASWAGCPYSPDPTMSNPDGDVGHCHVRHTELRNGSLIVRPQDKNDNPYILIVGKPSQLMMIGWLFGWQAKRFPLDDKGKSKRPPAYFVRQENLRHSEADWSLLRVMARDS